MNKEAALVALAAQCKQCQACNLAKTRTKVVFGSGSPESRILLIGEGPGQTEDETGIPFVGQSGRLLTRLLTETGLSRETDVFVTNVVKCRPPGNRDPEPAESEACKPWLTQQLEILQPAIIVLVGRIAAANYLGREVRITRERGQWLPRQREITQR